MQALHIKWGSLPEIDKLRDAENMQDTASLLLSFNSLAGVAAENIGTGKKKTEWRYLW